MTLKFFQRCSFISILLFQIEENKYYSSNIIIALCYFLIQLEKIPYPTNEARLTLHDWKRTLVQWGRDYINSSGDLDETHSCISGDQIPNFTKLKLLNFLNFTRLTWANFFFK